MMRSFFDDEIFLMISMAVLKDSSSLGMVLRSIFSHDYSEEYRGHGGVLSL
jgi:hypothetical protein